MAQLVEHRSPKPRVGGSSPSGPANFIYKGCNLTMVDISKIVEELKKVTWPKWEEVKNSTMLVIVFSVSVALFLAAFGLVFNKLIEMIK